MADGTEQHVQVNVSLQPGGTTLDGFGMPAVATHNASDWEERSRTYANMDGVAEDWGSETPEYRAFNAIFSQNPRPPEAKAIRIDTPVILQYGVGARGTIGASKAYALKVKGEGFESATLSYTTPSSDPLAAHINNAMLTQLNAIASNNYTADFADLVVADFVYTADAGTDTLTKVAHTLKTGDGPFQTSNTGGALPAGLAAVTNYWAIRTGADTFKLATSLANALAGTAVDLTTNGTGVQTLVDVPGTTKSPDAELVVTADSAGEWFSIEAVDSKQFKVRMTHTVSGLADELSEVVDEDPEWYCLLVLYPSTDYVLDAAAWVEANERVMVIDVPETDALNVAVGSGTDTLKQLQDLNYKNTMYAYHHAPDEFLSAAWMGAWLWTKPGQANTKFNQLSGVSASKINPNQRTNLTNRKGNGYTKTGAYVITWEGTVGSTVNRWFDTTRNLHWAGSTVRTKVFDIFVQNRLVPYTPEGTQMVQGAVEAMFALGIRQGVFSDVPPPTVTVPVFEEIDDADRADRVIRNILGTGRLAGAMNKAIVDLNVSF